MEEGLVSYGGEGRGKCVLPILVYLNAKSVYQMYWGEKGAEGFEVMCFQHPHTHTTYCSPPFSTPYTLPYPSSPSFSPSSSLQPTHFKWHADVLQIYVLGSPCCDDFR